MGSRADDAAFLAWLRRRHPALSPRDVRSDVERLRAAGVLEAEPDAAARRIAESERDEASVERLLLLHSAWRAFERAGSDDAVAWVGAERAANADEGPTWVEQSAVAARSVLPGGAPPELVPDARRRRRVAPERARLRWHDLLVPLAAALVLGAVGAAVVVKASRADEALARGRAALAGGREPLAQVRGLELSVKAHAIGVLEAQRARRDALGRTCEGGPWCAARRAAVDADAQRAEELVRLLGAAPEADRIALAEAPLVAQRRALRAEARALAAEASNLAGDDDSALERQRLERRAVVLRAEADALARTTPP